MSATIDRAFVTDFQSEVHEAYQRRGSKLRNAVRVKSKVRGSTTTFMKVGQGQATTKARHALVPLAEVVHSKVECALVDYYVGDWVDKLDELKVEIDERKVLVNAGAYALGRKSDELILGQLAGLATGPTMSTASAASFRNGVLGSIEVLNGNDVPDDGDRWGIVSAKYWSWLMVIEEFTRSDFVGLDELPYRVGRFFEVRHWAGVNWMQHSGVSKTGDISSNLLFHKTAVGHGVGQEVKADITWHGDRAAHFINHSMSQGSVLIDSAGGVKMTLDESQLLATS